MYITHPIYSLPFKHALQLAEHYAQTHATLHVFFHQDATLIANAHLQAHSPALQLQTALQHLHLDLAVCVSNALARGISDSAHHPLGHSNVAKGFRLTGLGELAENMAQAHVVIQL